MMMELTSGEAYGQDSTFSLLLFVLELVDVLGQLFCLKDQRTCWSTFSDLLQIF